MRLLYSKSFVILLIIIFIISIILFFKETYKSFTISQDIRSLENRIKEIEKSNEKFSQMEQYLQSEDFLQREARLKLNLTKPGEKLIIVKTPEKTLDDNEKQELVEKQKNNIQLWWEYFFEK